MENAGGFAMWRRMSLIVSGSLLYLFITCHLVNLSLGMHSVRLMDDWRPLLTGPWTAPPLSGLLVLSLLAHFLLALLSICKRNTLRLGPYDMVQLLCGLIVVPLLAPHVTGVIAATALGAEPSYAFLLPYFWVDAPGQGLRQVLLLTVIWLHGSIGMFSWLRARETTRAALILFYPLVVAIPLLALLGYVEAGRHVIPVEMGGSGAGLAEVSAAYAAVVPVDPGRAAQIMANMALANRVLILGALLSIAAAFGLRALRLRGLPRDRSLWLTYCDDRPASVRVSAGLTLLELAREQALPHASICNGRGRCGTCRVRVLSSSARLPAPDALERKTLARHDCPTDVRLACQLVPGPGRLEVERIIAPDYSDLSGESPAAVTASGAQGQGA